MRKIALLLTLCVAATTGHHLCCPDTALAIIHLEDRTETREVHTVSSRDFDRSATENVNATANSPSRGLYARIVTDPKGAFREMATKRGPISISEADVVRPIALTGDLSVGVICLKPGQK